MTKIAILTFLSTFSLMTHAANKEAQRQCVVDVCGTEKSYLAFIAKGPFGKTVPLDLRIFLDQKVDPLLNQISDLSAADLRLKMDALPNLLERLKTDPLSSEQTSALIMITVLNKIGPLLNQSVIETQPLGMKFAINAEKLHAKAPQIDFNFLNRAVKVINRFFTTSAAASAQNLSNLNFDLFKKEILADIRPSPGFTIEFAQSAAMQGLASDFAKRAEKIKQRIGPFSFEDLNLELLSKINSSQLTNSDKVNLMSLFGRIYACEGILNPEVLATVAETRLSVSEILNVLEWEQHSVEIKKTLHSPEQLAVVRDGMNRICHAQINQAIAAAPSELRQRKANELIDRVKVAAKTTAASYLTGNALNVAQKAIDNVQFATPLGQSMVRENILQNLHDAIATSITLQTATDQTMRDGSNWKSLVVRMIGSGAKNPAEVVSLKLKNVCESFEPAPFEDKALSAIGAIQMGWQTASFPTVGAGVIAHEIGHIVSGVVKVEELGTRDYLSARSCSNEQHFALMKDQIFAGSSSQYQEEDWADSFAATTLKELQKTWPFAKNFACALIDLDANETYGKLNLLELGGGDVHSTGFYRVLQMQTSLGLPMPASCHSAMSEPEFSVISRSCAK